MTVQTFADAFAKMAPAQASGVTGTFAMAGQTVAVNAGALAASYADGQQVFVTLDQDVASVSLAGIPSGGVMELVLTQDATGGRGVTWPAGWLAAGGIKPELPPYPGSVSRILVSVAGGRTFLDFAGLDYR